MTSTAARTGDRIAARTGARIGAHVGAHVGQDDPITEALARGGDVAQFFLGDPQGWKAPKVSYAGGAPALRAAAATAGIDLYVHAPYVLNVATTNNRIRIPSRKLLSQHAELAASVGAKGLIVHGGHLGKDDDPQIGLDNWCKTFERMEPPLPILIENTAGGGNAMARSLERIGRLWEALSDRVPMDRVGLCLDTCHAHAGGEELLGLVDRVTSITGRIDLVHANGSRDAFGSGADRHANLDPSHADPGMINPGMTDQGMIDFGPLDAGSADPTRLDPQAVVAVCAAAGAPVVCETPGGQAGQAADIAYLRAHLAG